MYAEFIPTFTINSVHVVAIDWEKIGLSLSEKIRFYFFPNRSQSLGWTMK